MASTGQKLILHPLTANSTYFKSGRSFCWALYFLSQLHNHFRHCVWLLRTTGVVLKMVGFLTQKKIYFYSVASNMSTIHNVIQKQIPSFTNEQGLKFIKQKEFLPRWNLSWINSSCLNSFFLQFMFTILKYSTTLFVLQHKISYFQLCNPSLIHACFYCINTFMIHCLNFQTKHEKWIMPNANFISS